MTEKAQQHTIEVFAGILLGYAKNGNRTAAKGLRAMIEKKHGAAILASVDELVKTRKEGWEDGNIQQG